MTSKHSINKKRIAINTLLLYVRMFLTMPISLYTSRVVLNVLGISDYGVYNIVGSIVLMLTFLNSAMTASSQRFISYELGHSKKEDLQKIFITSVNIHLFISLIIVLISETIGLWFINTYLNISPDRMVAANWVYQFSILTFITTVLSVPYNSCIIAHERMQTFAYISILEVVMKLAIAVCLKYIYMDKLILYSFLLFVTSIVVRVCYGIYCKVHFEECSYQFFFNKKMFNTMFSFSSWSVIGNLGFTLKDQISNIILNLFFGITVNAARGVATQVVNIMNVFSANFSMALNPQIIKQYAAGNLLESQKLVYIGARYTFYLLSILTLPIMINLEYLLKWWLGIVPEYTTEFLQLSLCAALLHSMSGTTTTALQATGHIKTFQLGICIIMISELPIAYLLLRLGYPPYAASFPTLVTYFIGLLFRFKLLKDMIPSYKWINFIYPIIKNIILFGICIILCLWIHNLFPITNFQNVILTSLLSICIWAIILFTVCISRTERKMLLHIYHNKQ